MGTGRQYSLVGDAELDEGACWEAILDPMVGELGQVVWVVDVNRQSLDRVVPNLAPYRMKGMFEAAGWQVITVKYGHRLEMLFGLPGGVVLRERIDEMSNPEYQRLLRCDGTQLRERLPGEGPRARTIRDLVDHVSDGELRAAYRNLGGHDLHAYRAIDDSRPTVILADRAAPHVGARVVTVSPDVSSSTNLRDWVNKVGVWSHAEQADWFADDKETILHWRERPEGQHIELGIAETNLVGLLGELGAAHQRWGKRLLPIGVLYDPFVERALEPWSFGMYARGRSVLVGTPSGVSLAPEGGAHQSVKTPSIGLEQPGCLAYEPAFAIDTEWTLLAALRQLGAVDGRSAYLRLSTRPVDQRLAAVPTDPAARARRRRNVVAGAYVLRPARRPSVTVCAMGPVVTEALAAAERLAAAGYPCEVICITSAGLLFEATRARRGLAEGSDWILSEVFRPERAAPMLTVLDGHPHTLAFLAGINQVASTNLGVTGFGQSGDLDSVYRHHGLDTDSMVEAALRLAG